MLIFLYTIIFAALLNKCNGAPDFWAPLSSKSNDVNTDDNLNYIGDPITFACVTTKTFVLPNFYSFISQFLCHFFKTCIIFTTFCSQQDFFITEESGSISSALINRLHNGRDLSLLFLECLDTVNSSYSMFYHISIA